MRIFRNENSSQRNVYSQYSNYSDSGLIPNKRALRLLGRVRLGIFRNKNVFRNIFWLFCSWDQNSQNGIQVFRNENSSQTNAYLHYSNYSYSGLIPNERALSVLHTCERVETKLPTQDRFYRQNLILYGKRLVKFQSFS